MYILSTVIIIIGIYIFASSHGSRLRRWFSAFMLSLAPGVFSIALYNANSGQGASHLERMLYWHVNSYIFVESNCFMPYTLLILSILLVERESKKNNALLFIKIILLVPVIVMHIVSPPGRYFNSALFTSYYLSWSLLYYLLASALAIYAWIRAKDSKVRRKIVIVSLLILTISITTLILGYVLPLTFRSLFYEILQVIIVVILILFAVITLRYGILGIRLRIESSHYNMMTDSMSPGAVLLSHSIKNEINKISICSDNIRSRIPYSDDYVTDNLCIIDHSVAHLTEMTRRIRFQMQDYDLRESVVRLIDIVEDALSSMNPLLNTGNISVVKDYGTDIRLICDPAHIREVLTNILSNAAEAVDENGKLEICVYSRRGAVCLVVSDNGKGIPSEDMKYIFNPFFTTKKNRSNYGLGLSYCYGVMKRHGASIKIRNRQTGGTEVSLKFPQKRIIHPERSGLNG